MQDFWGVGLRSAKIPHPVMDLHIYDLATMFLKLYAGLTIIILTTYHWDPHVDGRSTF